MTGIILNDGAFGKELCCGDAGAVLGLWVWRVVGGGPKALTGFWVIGSLSGSTSSPCVGCWSTIMEEVGMGLVAVGVVSGRVVSAEVLLKLAI